MIVIPLPEKHQTIKKTGNFTMIIDPIIPEIRVRSAVEQGFWRNKTVIEYFDEAVSANPDKTAIVEYRSESGTRNSLSYS